MINLGDIIMITSKMRHALLPFQVSTGRRGQVLS